MSNRLSRMSAIITAAVLATSINLVPAAAAEANSPTRGRASVAEMALESAETVQLDTQQVLDLLAQGGYNLQSCQGRFRDVQPGHPFCEWIERMAELGITSGCGGGNFCPDASVTRGQMSVFTVRTVDGLVGPVLSEHEEEIANLWDEMGSVVQELRAEIATLRAALAENNLEDARQRDAIGEAHRRLDTVSDRTEVLSDLTANLYWDGTGYVMPNLTVKRLLALGNIGDSSSCGYELTRDAKGGVLATGWCPEWDGSGVVGGERNFIKGSNSLALTGFLNSAYGDGSAIIGGYANAVSSFGSYAVVTGGSGNYAGGQFSVVSGGRNWGVVNNYDWRAGGYFWAEGLGLTDDLAAGEGGSLTSPLQRNLEDHLHEVLSGGRLELALDRLWAQ